MKKKITVPFEFDNELALQRRWENFTDPNGTITIPLCHTRPEYYIGQLWNSWWKKQTNKQTNKLTWEKIGAPDVTCIRSWDFGNVLLLFYGCPVDLSVCDRYSTWSPCGRYVVDKPDQLVHNYRPYFRSVSCFCFLGCSCLHQSDQTRRWEHEDRQRYSGQVGLYCRDVPTSVAFYNKWMD